MSGVRVDCTELGFITVENWEGLRQPYTPPPPWMPPPPQPPPAPQRPAAVQLSAAQLGALSFGVALAGTLALLAAALAVRQLRRRAPRAEGAALEAVVMADSDSARLLPIIPPTRMRRSREGAEGAAGRVAEAEAEAFHVFLSYRRADAVVIGAVCDKLRLCGLRVFKDVDGLLAGQPFDAALIHAMRGAPVFAPVVTLASVQRLASSTGDVPDIFLAELLVALCLRETGEVRLIHPLLLGFQTKAAWISLVDEPAYDAALAALPDAPSAATVALVETALRRAGAPPMPQHMAALSVREVLLGRAAGASSAGGPAVAGVLSDAPFALACTPDDLGLYIVGHYVPPIWDAVHDAKQRPQRA